MLKEKKPDRRMVKTKKIIKQTLISLIKNKDINDLSVKELTSAAGVSRKTFYYYYEGIWQVVKEIEKDISDVFEEAFHDSDIKKELEDPCLVFTRLNNIINENVDFFGSFLTGYKNQALIDDFVEILVAKFKSSFGKIHPDHANRVDISARYCVTGMLSVFHDWINKGKPPLTDRYFKDLRQVIFRGLDGVFFNF